MSTTVKLAELPTLVGKEIGISDWFAIDQDRVNKFAEATGDFQWIHVDVERADKEMGGTIVHGYLTLSLLPFLGGDLLTIIDRGRGLNYGVDKLRFTSMVKTGKRVRLRQSVLAVEPKAGGMQARLGSTIEIEGEERPALVCENIILVFPA